MAKQTLRTLVLSMFACSMIQCGEDVETQIPESKCSTNSAAIVVHNGALQNMCGCAEADGTLTERPNLFTCTVNAGTSVIFLFANPPRDFQIIPNGAPELPASPLIRKSDSTRAHGFVLDTPGTYPFLDAFDTDLVGEIVVL